MLAILLAAFLSSSTLNSNEAANGPQIKFSEKSHSFGKIPRGKPVTHVFTFTNEGDEPLVLMNVKASCGCTTPFYPTEPIQPGESNKIKVTYNAASPGRFHKSVTIRTNQKTEAGTQHKTVLFIKGEVVNDQFEEEENGNSPVRINKD